MNQTQNQKTINLVLTCLCDSFYGEVGIATVRLLEFLGYHVNFDSRQTCCGQPPFNAGDWEAAKAVAKHQIKVLEVGESVLPSGSCTAMIREGYRMLGLSVQFDGKVFELSELLIRHLDEFQDLKPYPKTVAIHRSCHGRGLHLTDEMEKLLKKIPDIEVVEFASEEQCCGFGGVFSAFQGHLSQGIGLEKIRAVQQAGATEIISGDMGCLMHLQGLLDRNQLPLRLRHFAEVLAECLNFDERGNSK
jgi:L-lactate dehydrogenase complex protein LldE